MKAGATPIFMGDLSRAEQDALYAARECSSCEWCFVSSRTHRRRTIRSLEAKGLLRFLGVVDLVWNYDHPTREEREVARAAWEITKTGLALIDGAESATPQASEEKSK